VSDAVTIEGLEELSEMLTTLAPQAAKRYMLRVAKSAAQVVLDAANETVPVGQGILKDALISQTHWGSDGDQTSLEIEIGPMKGIKWGSMQEFGTVTNEPQHWLGRAWDSSKDECLNVFATEATGLLMDLENNKK